MTELDTRDTFSQVVNVIAETLKIERESITDNSTLQDLGADSLDMVKMIMALEEQFDIQIDDEKAEHMKNVHDVVMYVHMLRAHK